MKYYNFTAYLQRNTIAIKKNIDSEKKTFIIKRACQLLIRFDEYSRHMAIKSWCNEFQLSEKILQSYISGIEDIEFTNTELLRNFLDEFTIYENEISGQVDIEKNGVKYTHDELKILVEEEGLIAHNLKHLLTSSNKNITVVKIVNPLEKLFLDLADNYHGEPLLRQLSGCIKAFDFTDKENGFYQERLEYYLHKWLCKAAGQALHISANDAMLLWIEPFGGSGKSKINQWFFSLPELHNYYIKISENESFMDMKGISRSKFAIDWDELPLSKKRYLMFKSYVASDYGQRYDKTSKNYESYTRHVNFIGSTNKANRQKQTGFLLDDDAAMMRRIIPIEIDGQINYQKYLKDIDLKQLWGQVTCEILKARENNNQKLLTWENDYDDLREQNRRYLNIYHKNDKEIIRVYYQPANMNEGRFISAREMMKELKMRKIKIKMNEWELGNFLRSEGYLYGRNYKTGKGWFVK